MIDRVTLVIEGLMCERLINRALNSGARVARIRRLSRREIELSADRASAKIIMDLAKRYSLGCDVCKKRGLSAFIDYAKSRATLIAALLVFAALSFMALSRVWRVEITLLSGDMPVGARELLNEMGIAPGAHAKSIDPALVAARLRALEGCSHASVSLTGVCALIELAGEIPAPEVFDISAPRDIIAARDCVIVSIDVRAGTALVKPGDTVRAGQTLIAGRERVSKESARLVGALGEARARMWFEARADGDTRVSRRVYTGEISKSTRVKLFNYSLPINSGVEIAPAEREYARRAVVGLFLPLYIEREKLIGYIDEEIAADISALDKRLDQAATISALAKIQASGLKNVKIIDKWTEYSIIDTDTRRARCCIEIEADAAAYLEEY